MSNALEQASLIMVPSGYEDGTLGSLKPTDGSGDFTFTRCDGAAGCDLAATRVNADGYIEKGYENLLKQSNSFDTTWTNYLLGIPTSGQEGYDGTTDAWLIECTNTSNFNGVRQVIGTTGVTTLSVYAKAGTTNFLGFYSSAGFGGFELIGAGTTGQIFGNAIDSKIELISNGWYRCSIVLNGNADAVIIGARSSINSFSAAIGDNVYIQDAMLNQGLVAYPYIETTTAPVAGGILEDMPRLDYSNGSCPALLLEPSRTNLIPQSEYLTNNNSFSSINLTLESGFYESPEGLSNAYKWTTTNPNSNAFVDLGRFNTTIGTTYSFSFYLKSDASNVNVRCAFTRGSTEQITTELTTEWKRFDITFTADDSSKDFLILLGDYGITNPAQTIFVYGIMQEAASYPTSYIPTYGVSQTRLGEGRVNRLASPITFASGENFTLFFDGEFNNPSFNSMIMGGRTTSISYWWIQNHQSGKITSDLGNDMANWTFMNLSINTRYKMLVKRDSNVIKFFLNGVALTTNQSSGVSDPFTFQSLGYGFNDAGSYSFSGKIHQSLIFPEALSDDECIELTTIS
jgi:hypothetical protein